MCALDRCAFGRLTKTLYSKIKFLVARFLCPDIVEFRHSAIDAAIAGPSRRKPFCPSAFRKFIFLEWTNETTSDGETIGATGFFPPRYLSLRPRLASTAERRW